MAQPAYSRVVETFLELVRIDSPSREEAACAAYCAYALTDVGCSVAFDDTAKATGSDTGNLIAELPGTLPGTLVLSAHLDTVEPGRGVEPVVSDGVIFSAGDTILGADDKCGLAAAIECVRRIAESGEPHPTLRCVFTVQEEVGLTGAKHLDPAHAHGDLCLVLDADGAPGGIIIGAPTHMTFKAVFLGKAAHAGVSPELGVSAIEMASRAIDRMELGRLDEQSTANVGSIQGGTATNVVAARVEITGECRSLDSVRVERIRTAMSDAMESAARESGGSVEIAWQTEYEGFLLDEDSPLVDLVRDACLSAGLTPSTRTTGGGSDANILAAKGVPTLALSSGMQGVHGVSEQIAIADIEALADLCVAVVRRLGARSGART